MSKELALSVVIGAAVAGAVNGFKTVIQGIDGVGKAINKLNKEKIDILENNSKLKNYKQNIKNIEDNLKSLRKEKDKLTTSLAITKDKNKLEELNKKLSDTKLRIHLLNQTRVNLKEKFKDAKEEVLKTDKTILSLESHIKKLSKHKLRLEGAKETRRVFKEKILETVAIGASVVAPIKVAMDFESSLADVKKVVDFKSKEEIKKFKYELLSLSTVIPKTANELATIAASGGQLGIAKKDIIGFTKVVAKMGTAFDMDSNEAGENIAKLMNVYKLSINEVQNLGDAINHLSDNTSAKAKDIVNVLARVGGTAKMFGLTTTQVSALADAFLAMGKPPEVAATAINALLLKLNTADKQGKKFQAGLKKLGLSSVAIKFGIKNNPQKTLELVFEKIKKFDKQTQMGILSDMFGAEYSDDIALLVAGLDNYKKALKLTSKEEKYLGSMQREFQKRSETTQNKLKLLKNSISNVGISIGEMFLPAISKGAEVLKETAVVIRNFTQEYPTLSKSIAYTAGGLGTFAVATSVMGYAFSFLVGGFSRTAIAGLGLFRTISKVKNILLGGLGLVGTTQKTNSLKSGLCGASGCALKAGSNFLKLRSSVLLLGGAVGVLAGAFVALNSAILNSANKDIVSKRVTGKSLAELKKQEEYLKKRIKESKEGGLAEWFLHGSNSEAKIKELEKRLKHTQKFIKKAEQAANKKQQTASQKTVGTNTTVSKEVNISKEESSHDKEYKKFKKKLEELSKQNTSGAAPIKGQNTTPQKTSTSENKFRGSGDKNYNINITINANGEDEIAHKLTNLLPNLIKDLEAGLLGRAMYDM